MVQKRSQTVQNCFKVLQKCSKIFQNVPRPSKPVLKLSFPSFRSPSTRTVASIWWFFTLIMVSSYTANLAAFLTVESVHSPINSAEDLQKSKIPYGAKAGGSTYNFFENAKYATYHEMYKFMQSHPEHMAQKNEDGVDWVKTKDYAFLVCQHAAWKQLGVEVKNFFL